MNRVGISEAAPIVLRLLKNLSLCVASSGLPGSQARTALGDVAANVASLLSTDSLGAPLANCFAIVAQSGATQPQLDQVRVLTEAETPQTLGGIMVKNSGVYLCLATEAQIIAGMAFVSRQDVDALKKALRQPFDDAEETAADEMDQATFIALVELDAAITSFLVTTARPLPRMTNYQFAVPLPSLVLAYRLYQDASRADQIVQENKIVHPAFCPAIGLALSA